MHVTDKNHALFESCISFRYIGVWCKVYMSNSKKGGTMKKQIIVYALTGVLALGIAGCGSSKKKSDSSSSSAETTTETQQATPKEEEKAPESEYAVTINSAEVGTDYNGSPCVFVHYTFTNVSHKDPASFMFAISSKVYQGGVECKTAFADTDGGGESMTEVKAGSSIDVTQAFELRDTTTPIEVECSELISFNDTTLATAKFEIA